VILLTLCLVIVALQFYLWVVIRNPSTICEEARGQVIAEASQLPTTPNDVSGQLEAVFPLLNMTLPVKYLGQAFYKSCMKWKELNLTQCNKNVSFWISFLTDAFCHLEWCAEHPQWSTRGKNNILHCMQMKQWLVVPIYKSYPSWVFISPLCPFKLQQYLCPNWSGLLPPGWVVWVQDCESWVAGSIPFQWTGMLYRYVVRWLKNCFLSTRFGGHHWQIEKWSRIFQLVGYVYSHPIPMWDGVVWWVTGLSPVCFTHLK
jgi:hypothetical protein